MPAPLKETGDFPNWLGMIFMFNLVVGTGVLTLPNAFSKSGWAISPIISVTLCFISYITMTYMIEAIALGNGYVQYKLIQENEMKITEVSDDSQGHTVTEEEFKSVKPEVQSLIKSGGGVKKRFYHLDSKLEMGELVNVFFGRYFKAAFYVVFLTYMIGESTLYVCVIGTTCTNMACEAGTKNDDLCRKGSNLKKIHVYRLVVLVFWMTVTPFTYFKLQKTKYLQIFTLIVRWMALLCMVLYTFILLQIHGIRGRPPAISFENIPNVIGSSVFCFMCHHSIPGLIYPFRNKHHMALKMAIVEILIFLFYMTLTIPGMFAFDDVGPVYNLNFIGLEGDKDLTSVIVSNFLAIFPIFPLITSYPIITITLQNNMMYLFYSPTEIKEQSFFIRRLLFPTCACMPSILIAMATNDFRAMVDIIMAYPGVFVQFVFPCAIWYQARRKCGEIFGQVKNKYETPFSAMPFYFAILVISLLAMIFESYIIGIKIERMVNKGSITALLIRNE